MGGNKSKLTQLNANLNEDELALIDQNFKLFIGSEKELNANKLSYYIFNSLPITEKNLILFLNKYYSKFNVSTIEYLEEVDYFILGYILIKGNDIPKGSTFFILYDILMGKIDSFNEDKFDYFGIELIFKFLIHIFIERHEKQEALLINFNEDQLSEFLRNTFSLDPNDKSPSEVQKTDLMELLNQLVNLELFLKNHFKLKFYGLNYDIIPIPLLHEVDVKISTALYLIFCLANPFLNFKDFAYKLYDSTKDGLCLQTAINSFVGFGGSIVIFLNHFDNEEYKSYTIGGYINSNIKETFGENYCGDEKSFVFSLFPKMKFYNFVDDIHKIAYISSRNLNFYNRKPGIGFGGYHEKFKLWIDAKDISHQSYFMKFDDVFEEGSPFSEPQYFLNIISMQIIGFGNNSDYDKLLKKQERDSIYKQKLKKIDKKVFKEYDTDLLLSETFSHQQYGHSQDLEDKSK